MEDGILALEGGISDIQAKEQKPCFFEMAGKGAGRIMMNFQSLSEAGKILLEQGKINPGLL